MPALAAEYGITNTSFGVILTLVGFVYGLSKFVNGIIADRANARWHLVIGLGACVLLNFAFGWGFLFLLMTAVSLVGAILVGTLWNIPEDGYIH